MDLSINVTSAFKGGHDIQSEVILWNLHHLSQGRTFDLLIIQYNKSTPFFKKYKNYATGKILMSVSCLK